MKMKKLARLLLCVVLCLIPLRAPADGETGIVYTVYEDSGAELFQFAGAMEKGDEYISADNKRYVIDAVDDAAMSARAVLQGEQEMPNVGWLETSAAIVVSSGGGPSATDTKSGEKLIAMYSTHSSESYKPTDGTESAEDGRGGIYDVDRAIKKALEEKGVTVVLDETIHAPHDSGAYRRSRQTAVDLLKKAPDALLDIHRDGIPNADEYKTTVNGKEASKVRLLVGRSNQNSAANKQFALELKSVADKKYPGLIKDIFIGKGSYNQDLMSNAILIEMGTHTLDKERVMNSTEYVSSMIVDTLYGGVSGAASDGKQAKANQGAGSGILWMVVVVAAVIGVYAILQTGGGKAAWEKVKHGASEMTAGAIGKNMHDGKKPDRDDEGPDGRGR